VRPLSHDSDTSLPRVGWSTWDLDSGSDVEVSARFQACGKFSAGSDESTVYVPGVPCEPDVPSILYRFGTQRTLSQAHAAQVCLCSRFHVHVWNPLFIVTKLPMTLSFCWKGPTIRKIFIRSACRAVPAVARPRIFSFTTVKEGRTYSRDVVWCVMPVLFLRCDVQCAVCGVPCAVCVMCDVHCALCFVRCALCVAATSRWAYPHAGVETVRGRAAVGSSK
jgi:hypothetical protein